MDNCNHCIKAKKIRGRRREPISFEDFKKPPTETMIILANMKNDNHSWRSLADELNHGKEGVKIGPSLVRRVALGLCTSSRIDYALGIRPSPPPVKVIPCSECGQVHKQRKACQPSPRPKGKVRLSLWVTEEERDFIRAAWDSHPDGRTAWNMEHAQATTTQG